MITTKTGDDGQTTCGNRRVDKDDLLVEVIGEIDELQAVLELIDQNPPPLCGTSLEKGGLIDDLSQIMAELACGVKCKIYDLKIRQFEEEIDLSKQNLGEFIKFKNKKALEFNWARTVCRRVERKVVALNKKQKIDKNILVYFNRLSDYLFVKAIKLINNY